MNLSKKIYAAARRIPAGQVATYADLARAIGHPRAWRHVGTILSFNRDPETPCHRVVRSDGNVGGFSAGGRTGGTARKAQKLRGEGVRVIGERVDLRRYRIQSPWSLVIRH